MKRILLTTLALFFLLFCCSCSTGTAPDTPMKVESLNEVSLEAATNYVLVEMEQEGNFIIELYPEYAPKTVENFQRLVAAHFYDGLTFHRVYEGFMIQGGDPRGDGTGGSGTTVYGEFSDNDFTQNTLSHTRGVISMARTMNDKNSASSQFFIMLDDRPSMDGRYAAFGRVISGIEVIDAIAAVETTAQPLSGEKSRPVHPPVIKSMTFTVAPVSTDGEKPD